MYFGLLPSLLWNWKSEMREKEKIWKLDCCAKDSLCTWSATLQTDLSQRVSWLRHSIQTHSDSLQPLPNYCIKSLHITEILCIMLRHDLDRMLVLMKFLDLNLTWNAIYGRQGGERFHCETRALIQAVTKCFTVFDPFTPRFCMTSHRVHLKWLLIMWSKIKHILLLLNFTRPETTLNYVIQLCYWQGRWHQTFKVLKNIY